ncbi:MAG: serine/threonine-protein kinase [Nannocystaceae bacterium]
MLHTLGHGAMGTVYAALDPMLDRRVALKLLRVGASRDPARAKARLLAEAQAMAQVSSANVVTVHDVGEIDGGVFVAMELIDGATLREYVLDHAPPWRVLVTLLLQAAAGLAAVHRAGLVHRDVKPDNIMVGDDGRVRLMDLGIAQRLGTRSAPEDAVSSSGSMAALTRAAGTPPYMAPELQSEAASPASDQFALADDRVRAAVGCAAVHRSQHARTRRRGVDRPAGHARGSTRGPARGVRRDLPRPRGRSSARWRSIDGFAAALDESAAGRRRRLALAAAVVTALGLGDRGDAAHARGEPCPDPAPLLASAWNLEAAATLAAGLQARRGPASMAFVRESWARVSQALDELRAALARQSP